MTPLSCTRNGRDEAQALEHELTLDWNLFHAVETGAIGPAARCWESRVTAVVIGRHGNPATEVIHDACRADGVAVLRRFSGGGTVVLGRGCLNYAVALPLGLRPELIEVSASVRTVLDAIVEALGVEGLAAGGDADLAWHGRKVSGNAQRRGRRALIQHGTLLYDFDASLATQYLREPARRPAYRGTRRHAEFLGNLPLTADEIRRRLETAWRRLGAVDSTNLLR